MAKKLSEICENIYETWESLHNAKYTVLKKDLLALEKIKCAARLMEIAERLRCEGEQELREECHESIHIHIKPEPAPESQEDSI